MMKMTISVYQIEQKYRLWNDFLQNQKEREHFEIEAEINADLKWEGNQQNTILENKTTYSLSSI